MSNANNKKAADKAIKEAKVKAPKTDKVKFGRYASPPPEIKKSEFDLDVKLEDVTMTIVEPGLVGSNCHLQGIKFENGVSVEPATRRQIDRIAASLRVSIEGEGFETISQRVLKRDNEIEREEKLERGVEVATSVKAKDGNKIWTQDELTAIADEKGINGLREIADPLKLRSRSIPELIGKIMEVAGEQTTVTPPEKFSETKKPVDDLPSGTKSDNVITQEGDEDADAELAENASEAGANETETETKESETNHVETTTIDGANGPKASSSSNDPVATSD